MHLNCFLQLTVFSWNLGALCCTFRFIGQHTHFLTILWPDIAWISQHKTYDRFCSFAKWMSGIFFNIIMKILFRLKLLFWLKHHCQLYFYTFTVFWFDLDMVSHQFKYKRWWIFSLNRPNWADWVIESPCPSMCGSVCGSVPSSPSGATEVPG